MPLWILFTLLAAFAQNLRSLLQKRLTTGLTVTGATYVRFLYGLPFAVVYLALVLGLRGEGIPALPGIFFLYALVGGIAQIVGAQLLVALFTRRQFSIGTTYSKTETVQAALLGLIVLGDPVGWFGGLGILVSMSGVMLIAAAATAITPASFLKALGREEALMGIGVGLGFAIASVCYRGAAQSLPETGFLPAAALTLVSVLTIQTVVMGLWVLFRWPAILLDCLRAWRPASLIGLAGAIGSIGWFTAFALENAAYVKAVGQVEILFAMATSVLVFKERTNRWELAGIALVVGGVLLLILER